MRGPSLLVSLLVGLLLVPLLSGCLSPSSPTTVGPGASEGPQPTTGPIIDQTKEPLPAGANPELGALRGNILSKNGGGIIKNARVMVLGSDRDTTSNEYGAFAFNDVSPGEVTLRTEAPSYLAAEVQLVVEKGFLKRLNVTLEPEDPLHMEHVHDYWFVDGTPVTRRVLIESKAQFPWSLASGGEQTEPVCGSNAVATTIGLRTTTPLILSGNEDQCSTVPVILQGEGPWDAIVWPGTKQLDVTIDWKDEAQQYLPSLVLRYKPANSTAWMGRITFQPGDTKSIEVKPQVLADGTVAEMTDGGHMRWTKWRFDLIIHPTVAGEVPLEQGDLIRRLIGDFDVKIEAVKGVLPVEKAHPQFWAQGKSLVLLNNTNLRVGAPLATSLDASYQPNRGWGVYTRNASQPLPTISWTLPDGKIVPPGTTRLNVVLRYEDSLDLPDSVNSLKSLGFRTAGVNPARATLTDLKDPDHTKERGRATWSFPLDDPKVNDETDVVYSGASTWVFLLANEDQERDDQFVDEASAVGYTDFWLTVEAVNEKWQEQFDAGLI